MYPHYKATGILSKDEKSLINKKVYGLFCYKIGNVIVGSADNIVISAFLGLTITGLYGNYYYVITLLFGFLGIYYNAIRAGIGNSIILETKEKNYSDFKFLWESKSYLLSTGLRFLSSSKSPQLRSQLSTASPFHGSSKASKINPMIFLWLNMMRKQARLQALLLEK